MPSFAREMTYEPTDKRNEITYNIVPTINFFLILRLPEKSLS